VVLIEFLLAKQDPILIEILLPGLTTGQLSIAAKFIGTRRSKHFPGNLNFPVFGQPFLRGAEIDSLGIR